MILQILNFIFDSFTWFIVLAIKFFKNLLSISDVLKMNTEEREKLVEIVKQSNEVILGSVSYADAVPVTPALNLNDIVMAHVKSQCPECGKYLANVNEHLKLVHLKIRKVFCFKIPIFFSMTSSKYCRIV